jgi:peptide/nickel transport system permease protein
MVFGEDISVRRLLGQQPGLMLGALVIVAILIGTVFVPLPHDPLEVNPYATLQPPSPEHWFGTDQNGSDVLSRVVAAARLDVPLAIAGAVAAALIGVPLGLLASASGRASTLILRALDIFQSFPLVVLAVVLIALAGNNLSNVVYAIVLVSTPAFVRLIRGQALTVRASRFVEAAQALGASPRRITFVHVLPNCTATIFTQLSIAVGSAILTIAALAFIGVGIVPPTPSWGAMIRSGTQYVATGQWWLALFPGVAILVFVLSFNAIAEGLESLSRDDE